MCWLRPHLWLLSTLAALVALGLGSMAALGRARWGDAGWYFHGGPDYRLRHGQSLLRHGDADRALRLADLLETDGFADQAALLRGESHFRQGEYLDAREPGLASAQWARALEEFAKIRDQGDLRLDGAVFVGQCYVHLKQYRAAENALKFVVSHRPDEIDAHRGLAVLYYDLGGLTWALRHLERVAELDLQDGRPQRLMGLIYKDMDRCDAAVPCYQEALRRDLRGQDPWAVKKELAECLVRGSQFTEALEVLRDFDPAGDDFPAVQALEAECYWGQGRAAEARALLDEALAGSPNCVALYRLRAKLYLDANEPRAAVDLLRRALAIDPMDHASRYHLVAAYRRLGQSSDAQREQKLFEQTQNDFEEISRLNKEATKDLWDASVRLRLAELCEKHDMHQMAKMWRNAAARCLAQPGGDSHGTPAGPVMQIPPGG